MAIGGESQSLKVLVKNCINAFYEMIPQILKTSEKHTKLVRAGVRFKNSICYDFHVVYSDLKEENGTL